jgi:shikimate kinase
MRVNQPLLIIVTGPVGAGKSTTSVALAHALRRSDVSVAVIDLDLMYGFVRQKDGYGEQTAWTRARSGAGALANALLASTMSIVIVEGEFFTAHELNTLLAPIPPDIEHRFFTLRLSYEQALVRVQADPSRGASKDPVVLRSLHASFAQALPFLEEASVVIDTNTLTQEEVVAELVAALDDRDRFAD